MESPPVSKQASSPKVSHTELGWALALIALLLIHFATALVGWQDQGFAGHEFRQSQTALSTYFILRDHDYSVAYPTPVLGKPWSIPMEFPLYEWTVAKLVEWFSWPLAETGRGVSLACFYLTLPAWTLLLARAGFSRMQRGATLAMALTCPIYLCYSRAFLIESMALMFASWHLWCVLGALESRRAWWLVGAWVFGAAAATIKVTTWAVAILPCGFYLFWLIGKHRGWARPQRREWLGRSLWSLAAVSGPLFAALWWIRTADAIKAQNPAAAFLNSTHMEKFHFGTIAQRFSPDFWHTLFRQWQENLLPSLVLIVVGATALSARGKTRRFMLLCLASFVAAQLLFPTLYAVHSYYFYANAFLLCAVTGVVGCTVLDSSWPRPLRWITWGMLFSAGILVYHQNYWPRQRIVTGGTSGLSEAIQTFTAAEDVMVALGDDWSSILPYKARRRALMIPSGQEDDDRQWRESLAGLAGESIGVLVVNDAARALPSTVQRRLRELDFHLQPLFTFQDRTDVYFPRSRLHNILGRLRGSHFSGVDIPPDHLSPGGAQLFDIRRDRAAFIVMTPFPIRYKTPFDLPAWFEFENSPIFIAHTPTELEFHPTTNVSSLKLAFAMLPAAYEQHRSDGADIEVTWRKPDGTETILWRHSLNPRDQPADRGPQTATISLPQSAESGIFIRTLPGLNHDPAFDWIYFSEITFL